MPIESFRVRVLDVEIVDCKLYVSALNTRSDIQPFAACRVAPGQIRRSTNEIVFDAGGSQNLLVIERP